MAVADRSKTERIRELNDAFRRSFIGGRVMLTSGVNELADGVKSKILEAVKTFKDFDEGNDPHGEHDFASIAVSDENIFFKIDYYAPDMQHGSEDPADPEHTTRVMTIMLASEY